MDKLLNGLQIFKERNSLFTICTFMVLLFSANIALSAQTIESQTSVSGQTQERHTITGIVKDQSGFALIGAAVQEKGQTQMGVSTDLDGNFSLEVATNATIIISYIGFVTQEISTAGKAVFDITLLDDNQMLEGIVVVGYGTQKKENLTGAISQVSMDKVLGSRPVTSVSSALQGAIPGLTITGGTVPGTSKTINIRGTTSLNGGSPLVLIDNVPGDLDMVNPEDIESVTTLKDAASAAIYGARGAFGVIIITTKRAKKNSRISINYNTNLGFQVPSDKLEQADMLEILGAMQDWDTNNSYYADSQDYDKWKGYIQDHRSGELMNKYPDAYFKEGRFIPSGENTYYYLEPTYPQAAILDDYGFQQTHNLSATGGSEKITYRMSLGYTDQDGPLQMDKDTYNRITVSSYVSAEITKWLTTSLDIRYAKSERQYVGSGQVFSNVHYPIWYPAGDMVSSKDLDSPSYPTTSPLNYLKLSEPTRYSTENPRIFSRTEITPIKGLQAVFEYTYDRKNGITNQYNAPGNLINDQMQGIVLNSTPLYKIDKSSTTYNSLNAFATYKIDIQQKHNFKIMLGYNQDMRDYEYNTISRTELINPNKPSISGATGSINGSDSYKQYSIRSGFFRFNYDYDGKYLFEMNGRYDGSSKFPKDSRFGFFPSFSVGWNIANEQFMRSTNSWMNELKLRASWGQLGNQSIDEYEFYAQMNSGRVNWIVDGEKVMSLSMPGLISSNFTWEKVETLDIGLDFSFFNDRLMGTFDWYQRDTKGMLAPGAQIPQTAGTSAPSQNVADLRTQGWELAIQWRSDIGDWRYSIGFNIFDDRTKITKYNNEDQKFGTYKDADNKDVLHYREGMELGEIWGHVSDGFYTIEDFDETFLGKGQWILKEGVTSISGNKLVRPGDVKFKNLNDYNNKTNVIDNGNSTVGEPGDRKIIGNNSARYNFGINGSVGWKGFDLSFLLQGTGKRDFWYKGGATQSSIRFPMAYAFGTVYSHQLDYWQPKNTDDPNSADYYQPVNSNPEFARIYGENKNGPSNNRVQTQYLLDASYIRLKNLTVGYTVPTEVMNKIGLQSAKVFFSGENLFTISALPQGMDPERLTWGYPFFATYSFGISLTL